MVDINSLISGFRSFKATEYEHYKDMITHVVRLNEKPKTLIIACCDMRMAPGRVFSSNPGDLYVIRNLGAFVPEYTNNGVNGTISAVDCAVSEFEVENIIVMGHSNCHSMGMLLAGKDKVKSEPMKEWLDIGVQARDAVVNQLQGKPESEQQLALTQESILVSLKNLLSYPEVAKRVKSDQLKLYGWYLDITHGQLVAFNPKNRQFEPIE